MTKEDKYEMQSEYRDAETVREALDLDAQPLFVKMEGRQVVFEYPVSEQE
jgi:hypothetical protein